MSRWPIILDPSPIDLGATYFRALSEELSDDPNSPALVGQVLYDPFLSTCSFEPSPLWLQTGYFPRGVQVFSLGELESLTADQSLYAPVSIYTHRLLQAMRNVLRIHQEKRTP